MGADPPAFAFAPAGACKNGVDQVAHRINFSQLRLGHIAAQLLLEFGQQFNPLHGIESQIEFEVVGRADHVKLIAGSFAHNSEGTLYVIALQPRLLFVGERLLGSDFRITVAALLF